MMNAEFNSSFSGSNSALQWRRTPAKHRFQLKWEISVSPQHSPAQRREAIRCPPPMSSTTSLITPPWRMDLTVPLNWFRALRAILFSNDFHQHAFAPPAVEFTVKDLLPRPEIQLAVRDRHHNFPPHHL